MGNQCDYNNYNFPEISLYTNKLYYFTKYNFLVPLNIDNFNSCQFQSLKIKLVFVNYCIFVIGTNIYDI